MGTSTIEMVRPFGPERSTGAFLGQLWLWLQDSEPVAGWL